MIPGISLREVTVFEHLKTDFFVFLLLIEWKWLGERLI